MTNLFNGIKEFGLIGFGHLSKISLGFLVVKLIAVYHGPNGMGVLGHFMSAVAVVSVVSGGGITNAILRFASEYKNDDRRLGRFLSISWTWGMIFSVLLGVFILIFSRGVSNLLFDTDTFLWVIYFLALMPFIIANLNFIIGLINALGHSYKYSKIQISGFLLGVPTCWSLIYFFDIGAAALSIIVVSTVSIIPAAFVLFRTELIRLVEVRFPDSAELKILLAYGAIALSNAIISPSVEYLVRDSIIVQSGYSEAGLWQGILRLASTYVGFFGIFLSYWFLPRISIIYYLKNSFRFIIKTQLVILILFVPAAVIFLMHRNFFLTLFLSDGFIGISSYLEYQLLGDLFRVLSFVYGFVLVARGKMVLYILAQLLQGSLFYVIIYKMSLDEILGAEEAIIGYFFSWFIYFLIASFVFTVLVSQKQRKTF